MSKCGRTHLLDAMSAGEVAPALEVELRAHATTCARCHHELSWLESERQLFRHRAGRDEVQALWRGVEQRSPSLRAPSSKPRAGLARLLVSLAAGLVMVVGLGQLAVRASVAGEVLMSQSHQSDELLQSTDQVSAFMSSEDPQPCSKLTPGLGFHCGSAQINVLASR